MGIVNRIVMGNWARSRGEINDDNLFGAETILRDIYDSLTQVTLASDFLMMDMDNDRRRTELQLSCLIRERALSMKDQILKLNRVLNRELCPVMEH